MSTKTLPVCLFALAMLACNRPKGAPAMVIPLFVRGERLQVEIAADPAARERGLSFRRQVPPGTGMLFAFPREGVLGFYMRNTYVPLSIAFLDREGRIINIAEMRPLDERTVHRARGLSLFALEVPAGWFSSRGIRAGDRCRFQLPDRLAVK